MKGQRSPFLQWPLFKYLQVILVSLLGLCGWGLLSSRWTFLISLIVVSMFSLLPLMVNVGLSLSSFVMISTLYSLLHILTLHPFAPITSPTFSLGTSIVMADSCY